MTEVVDIEKARLDVAVRKGYRNWRSQFNEDFSIKTCLPHLSLKTLAFLVEGRDESTFYLYDLIMNLQHFGSGFEFDELYPEEKIAVIDRYLFLLDRIRFEYLKRLGYLESYPGEEFSLVELIIHFNQLGPDLQAKIPVLNRDHPSYEKFCTLNAFEKDELIRKLIVEALKET